MSASIRLNELDATMLARRLQQRDLSAAQLVRACLERIEEREGAVQAWTWLAGDAALAAAQQLDRDTVRGPLHGLPIGVKDLFDTFDMPTGYGSPIYAGQRPAADAAAVALARAAGAVVLGKTVTTEFATFNPGKTHNPHRPGHTPGGSSSGSAAAVADCMVPLAFGTQTAASIIRPAAFCGVVGFKPSYGSIARAGARSLAESLDTVGLFARSVDDAALFASVLCGSPRLAHLAPLAGGNGLRIGLCRTFEWRHADTETVALIETSAARLAAAGASVQPCALPAALSSLLQLQMDVMAYEAARNLADERLRHPTLLSPALTALLDAGSAIGSEGHLANLCAMNTARRIIDATFDDFDVLIAPSAVGAAPAGITSSGDPVFGRIWSLLGLPCIHLPCASNGMGLPLGVQAIGRFGQDARLLEAAAWMHRELAAGPA